MSWCTIESDPGVFTELIQRFGVKGAVVEEIFDMNSAEHLQPVYGLIFLFQWVKGMKTESNALDVSECPHIFFARQEVTNACATQAILNILLNSPDKLEIGPALQNFLEFTAPLDPVSRGHQIGSMDELRLAHNAFARHQNFSFEEKYSKDDDDEAYHFVAYIPRDNVIWELDGLKKGPCLVGTYEDGQSWLSAAKDIVTTRMAEFGDSQIRFTLLAVCKDVTNEQLDQNDPQYLAKKERQEDLVEKRKKWEAENHRRRHNYLPFIVELLKQLSRHGQLDALKKEAAEKKKVSDEKDSVRRAAKKEAKKQKIAQ
jgi:ubiquitin carboxyl-terminal hydrolase L5